ncbi:MAG: hypothetical protein M9882_05600 [Homoserinimonas sp.]|nr:hypothetical protein [Homoserinimonas sp.]
MNVSFVFRVGLLPVAACLVAISLTGCGIKFLPFEPADFPVAIQKDGASISAVACRQVKAEVVSVQFRDQTHGDWSPIFRATGEAVFSAGDEIFQASRMYGMSVSGPSSVPSAKVPQFYFSFRAAGSSYLSIFFSAKNLSDESWLHPDGSTSAVPCPEE